MVYEMIVETFNECTATFSDPNMVYLGGGEVDSKCSEVFEVKGFTNG
jgi:hypothetical protein